ncbi:MAG: hypothetical protein ABJC74_10295 [Gemmatimonadota bacterium]
MPLPASHRGTPVPLLLKSAALVALLDGILATMIYVVVLQVITVTQLFQSIAKAVLGQAAYDGGLGTEAVGLVMHFSVALTWSIIYWLLWQRWAGLRRFRDRWGPIVVGLFYGPLVWVIMDLVVMPFTHNKPTPVSAGMFWVMLAGHVVSVGIPIAVVIHPPVDS